MIIKHVMKKMTFDHTYTVLLVSGSKMNLVLFGDSFAVIESYLAPIHLYRLSQTSKDLNNMITENRIKINIIDGIKKRFDLIFGESSEELVHVLKMRGAMVVGSLIAQVMLDEIWPEDDVDICVASILDEKEEILKMTANHWYMKEEILKITANRWYMSHSSVIGDTKFSTFGHNIDEFNVFVRLFEHAHFSDDVDVFVYFDDHDMYNNFYNFGSNELRIDSMYNIFERQTNLQLDVPLMDWDFEKIYRRGFQFYSSRENKKILSNEEILHYMYHVIRVQKNVHDNKFTNDVAITIKNNAIYFEDDMFLPFHSAERNILDRNDSTLIHACENSACYVTMLRADWRHFHYHQEPDNIHCDECIIVWD